MVSMSFLCAATVRSRSLRCAKGQIRALGRTRSTHLELKPPVALHGRLVDTVSKGQLGRHGVQLLLDLPESWMRALLTISAWYDIGRGWETDIGAESRQASFSDVGHDALCSDRGGRHCRLELPARFVDLFQLPFDYESQQEEAYSDVSRGDSLSIRASMI